MIIWPVLFFICRSQVSKKIQFIAPHILYLNIVLFFSFPQTNMLLFATNQTNLKQKQNFSVYSNFKYWNHMHRWSGIFSCVLAVHVLKEAFSVFIVSCLLYLLSKSGLLEKGKIGSLVLWKGGWYGELGEGRGGGFLNSCWRRVWTTNTGRRCSTLIF